MPKGREQQDPEIIFSIMKKNVFVVIHGSTVDTFGVLLGYVFWTCVLCVTEGGHNITVWLCQEYFCTLS